MSKSPHHCCFNLLVGFLEIVREESSEVYDDVFFISFIAFNRSVKSFRVWFVVTRVLCHARPYTRFCPSSVENEERAQPKWFFLQFFFHFLHKRIIASIILAVAECFATNVLKTTYFSPNVMYGHTFTVNT